MLHVIVHLLVVNKYNNNNNLLVESCQLIDCPKLLRTAKELKFSCT
jgi:hypothetical protein